MSIVARGGFFALAIAACGAASSAACGGAAEEIPPAVLESPETSRPSPGAPSSNEPSAPNDGPDAPKPDAPVEPALKASTCFKDLAGTFAAPDYDKFAPTIAKSCAGTHHQDIVGVEKVVFLGDSVTAGTPPTLPGSFYRARLEEKIKTKFGDGIEFKSCAKWGARTNDLLGGENEIAECFPSGVEPKKTLVIMTNGGNDLASWAKDKLDTTAGYAKAMEAANALRSAIEWLKAPAHFPNGSFVLFANVYEYTDTSGELTSCPTASLSGLSGTWDQAMEVLPKLEEEYMRIAVETKTDMMFLFEHFCGHGYKRGDTNLQCYRGPDTELWFDLTCIHPTPKGHDEISKLFANVIEGL